MVINDQYFYITRININSVLIIAKDVISLDMYIDEIEQKLSLLNCNIDVYFDLLIKNGINKRFYYSNFNQKKKQITLLQKCKPQIEILKSSNNFFNKNIELIEESMKLRKAEKWLIKKHGTIKLNTFI